MLTKNKKKETFNLFYSFIYIMNLTLKKRIKKGGLFSFKKISPAKTTISPKQQSFTYKLKSKLSESFTNKLKSKLSEFIGVNVE